MTFKPTLCLDFDGVLHSYTSKWQDATVIPDPPVRGALRFLLTALEKFDVCILSSRSHERGGREAMAIWLSDNVGGYVVKNGLGMDDVQVDFHVRDGVIHTVQFPLHKPPAHLTIDDRALTFTGTWPSVDELQGFLPWNKEGLTADVEVPDENTDERGIWLEAAEQYGLGLICTNESEYLGGSEDQVLELMAACREQGRRDVLGLPPKEPK